MGEFRKRALGLGAGLLAIVAFAACASAPVASPTQSGSASPAPTSSASQSPTAIETSAPGVTEVPEPSAGGTALGAEASYETCVTRVAQAFAPAEGGTAADFVAVPFSEAEVIDRGDGYFWVWANVTNRRAPAGLEDTGAAQCVVGGSVENPLLLTYSIVTRTERPNIDPYLTPSD